ncbi:MAG: hypothetical protein KGI60_00365 [Patescibacteria group bacterium]|nr:hypothetical protein [Patescibacteria group bacterium]
MNPEKQGPRRSRESAPEIPTPEDGALFGYNPNNKTYDEESIEKVLQNHLPEELERLRILSGCTKEQIELYSQYAMLRKSTLAEMSKALEKRRQENPVKTPAEQKLGVLMEMIEPEVRDAIVKIQDKGYKTYESGFDPGAGQMIGFMEKYFQHPADFENLKNKLREQDINLIIEPDHLRIRFKRMYSIDEIKQVWDKIVNALPDLRD